jgi:hypothetical protein
VAAVANAKPEVVVHEMTSLGDAAELRRFDQSFAATNQLRTEGLVNLLAAASQAEFRRRRRGVVAMRQRFDGLAGSNETPGFHA